MRFIKSELDSGRGKIHIFIDNLVGESENFWLIKSACGSIMLDEREVWKKFFEIKNGEMIRLLEEGKVKERDFCKVCLISLQKTPYKNSNFFLDEGKAAKEVMKISEEYYNRFKENSKKQQKITRESYEKNRDLSDFIVLDRLSAREA